MSASPPPTLLPAAADLWRHSLEAMSPHASPCRYLTPARWAAIREAALDFLDRYGTEAHRLGWTAEDLFAVHPQHGTLRVDYCGALMINGRKATGLNGDRLMLGNQTAHRNTPGKVYGVPVCVFAKRGG